jgi:bacterioferritin
MLPVAAAPNAANASRRCWRSCAAGIARCRTYRAQTDRRFACQRPSLSRKVAASQAEEAMLRDPKVIEHLNTQLTNELTAINQYFLHARTLQHWGVTKLGKHEYDEFIGEMKDADELINRILFLDGLPNVQRLNPIGVGEDVEQILKADLALEEKALGDLREGITYCEGARDFVSRDLLLKILGREEEHVDFLERQFDLIKQIGIERYVMLNAAAAPDQDG